MRNRLADQFNYNVAPGPQHEPDIDQPSVPADPLVRLIAYYLPQFHPTAENDEWWGTGFTEWTNVTKTLPRFSGHYQPRLPGALGFYDLSYVDAIRRQAVLAKKYGIAGFCFYHYWFGGRAVLERPLQLLLDNPDIDLPFCLCWANENWTRTWDGSDKQVLLAQNHSAEDDIAFARSIEPAMRDPRYIRIGGRPLLMLYRPSILPDAAATVARWREHFEAAGLGNPYIAMAQTHGDEDPRPYGMDAAVGFPPHGGTDVNRVDPAPPAYSSDFSGAILQYDAMASALASRRPTEYRFMPGVCPSWDNDSRRPGRGVTFHGSTPAKYGSWLAAACDYAMRGNPPEERVVLINAWNEWAEGAYLEPDRHFGYAYLAETARVLTGLPDDRQMRARLDALPKPTPFRLITLVGGKLRSWAGAARNRRRAPAPSSGRRA